jgi:hypothetical protein
MTSGDPIAHALKQLREASTNLEQVWAVFNALSGSPKTVRQIAAETGCPKSTTHRHLQRFVDSGHAQHVASGYVLAGPGAPDTSFDANGAETCSSCGRSLTVWGGRLQPCSWCTEHETNGRAAVAA